MSPNICMLLTEHHEAELRELKGEVDLYTPFSVIDETSRRKIDMDIALNANIREGNKFQTSKLSCLKKQHISAKST